MAEGDSNVDALRRRWAGTGSVLKWASIPRNRRERVLAELEETARAERDQQLRSDLTLAVDVLDTENNAPLLELLKQAQADIQYLLDRTANKASEP